MRLCCLPGCMGQNHSKAPQHPKQDSWRSTQMPCIAPFRCSCCPSASLHDKMLAAVSKFLDELCSTCTYAFYRLHIHSCTYHHGAFTTMTRSLYLHHHGMPLTFHHFAFVHFLHTFHHCFIFGTPAVEGNAQLQCAVQTNNPVWKKNRNSYAKLLLNQLKQGRLEKPFNAGPPAGPLQTLPASLTYAFSLPRRTSTRSTLRYHVSFLSLLQSHIHIHIPCLPMPLHLLLLLLLLLVCVVDRAAL